MLHGLDMVSVQVLSICLISGSRQSVANTHRCGHSLGTANPATHIPNKDSSTGRGHSCMLLAIKGFIFQIRLPKSLGMARKEEG